MDHEAVVRVLRALQKSGKSRIDRECDVLAHGYIAENVEPQFTVRSAEFDSDPWFILADRYWNLRLTKEPTLQIAVLCAGWLNEHVEAEYREAVREKWTMGYGFITRGTVESTEEIEAAAPDIIASDPDGSHAYFAVLYHAAKLRADRSFDELLDFLKQSRLSDSIKKAYWDKTLFIALQAYGALGSEQTSVAYARRLADKAWNSPHRTRETIDVVLNGLTVGGDFDGRGELLRTRAAEAVAAFPDDHIFLFRLATGRRLCGDYDVALDSIRQAITKLPKSGWRISHELLQEQYMAEERLIISEQTIARQMHSAREAQERYTWQLTGIIEQHKQDMAALISSHEQQMKGLADSARRGHVRSIEMIALFVATIAFAVGTLNISLNGTLALVARLWMIAELGGGLLLFAFVIVGGTWVITRRE